MREDMAKVIVERARTGGTNRVRAGWRQTTDWNVLRAEDRQDESPRREKIRFKWSNTKNLSDHLNPLVRFVRGSVGRPWNKVHSEIAANLDRGNTVQRHVLEHLDRDIVHRSVVEQPDGTITDARGERLRTWAGVELFWVCPRTGLLRRRQVARRKWERPGPTIDVSTPYHEVVDVWYEITFARAPVPGLWDALVKEPVVLGRWSAAHWKDGGTTYAVAKRQLNSKEIRALGLRG